MYENKIEETVKDANKLGEEKRRWPRYTLDVAVKVAVVNSVGLTTQCFGRGNDISEGGMAIFVAHELPVGSKIRLTLTLPYAERPVICHACVRSRASYRYGVEFTDLGAFDKELLNRTCRSLSLVQ